MEVAMVTGRPLFGELLQGRVFNQRVRRARLVGATHAWHVRQTLDSVARGFKPIEEIDV
jgi:hypothetical protein